MERIRLLDERALPKSQAAYWLYENYDYCMRRDTSEFAVTYLPSSKDVRLFTTSLIALGIFSIVITSVNTTLIECLCEFQRCNWEIVGLDTVVEHKLLDMQVNRMVEGIRIRFKGAPSFVTCPKNWDAIGTFSPNYSEV